MGVVIVSECVLFIVLGSKMSPEDADAIVYGMLPA